MRLMSIGAAAALAVGSFALDVTPAEAAADCPRGYFCAWFHSGFNGTRYQSGAYTASWYPSNVHNNDSSWQNNFIGVRNVRVRDGATTTICVKHPQRGQSQVGYNAAANDRGDNHVSPNDQC